MKYQLMALDAGNAQIKVVTDQTEGYFPHALKKMSGSEVEAFSLRSDSTNEQIFIVNGVYYAIGEQAMRNGSGAVLLGEARYTREYYGVLAAIAAFHGFPASTRNIFLYGSHTPKDVIYRDDLINAVLGKWDVQCQSVKKSFNVVRAMGYDEPAGAFRHATLSEDGLSRRGQKQLHTAETAILDVGGLTLGISIADKSMIDYSSAQSHLIGILDVLDELRRLIRSKYRAELKGGNQLPESRLRKSLETGIYQAGGLGDLNVRSEVNEACNLVLTDILKFFQNYGGAGSFDAVLLAGGGSVLLEKKLREHLNHAHVYVAEEDRKCMHMATARGGMKVLRALEARGKL